MKTKGSKDGATWERQGPDSCLRGGAVAKSENTESLRLLGQELRSPQCGDGRPEAGHGCCWASETGGVTAHWWADGKGSFETETEGGGG